ncbi:MAG: TonB family protein [Acidobacteriia bacterium]|nr:TonB family protein [Terriglobia bacterium]
MGASTIALFYDRRENLRAGLLFSILFHALLFVLAISYATFGLRFGHGWGARWGEGKATQIGAVASLPGVPLPAPMLQTRNTVVTQNPGLHQSEPEPKEEPKPEAVQIPKFKEAVKPEKAERINTRIQKEKPIPPANAIPYGQGGQPTMSYTQVVNSAGTGGLSFGQGGAFGERYGWYVASVRSRISSNWLLTMISPNIVRAPRVYVDFEILRDGTVTHVELKQSSGTPEVDRSALRAILASSPLPPLPPDYSGNSVDVEFYFDLHR